MRSWFDPDLIRGERATQVLLVRHAERDAGAPGRLTATGEREAAEVAAWLADALPARGIGLLASPEGAAEATARRIALALGVELHLDEDLRELGLHLSLAGAGTPEEHYGTAVVEAARAHLSATRRFDRYPDSESAAALRARVSRARQRVRSWPTAVVVTHCLVINRWVVDVLGLDVDVLGIPPTGSITQVVEADPPAMLSFGEHQHLLGLRPRGCPDR